MQSLMKQVPQLWLVVLSLPILHTQASSLDVVKALLFRTFLSMSFLSRRLLICPPKFLLIHPLLTMELYLKLSIIPIL